MPDSIFKTAGTNLRDVLASHDLGEILYTSIDVAKYNHSAMVVNFFGDVIIPKFDFPYNNHGIDFLKKKIQTAQKQTRARKLFLGLESTGYYHENLVASLTASGYDVQDKTVKNKDTETTHQTILTTPFPYLRSDSQRRKEIQLGRLLLTFLLFPSHLFTKR